MDMCNLALPAPGTYRTLEVTGRRDGYLFHDQDCVAEEVPVAFEYNGISHAVMMATPDDLEDFALGFSLSEGIVESAQQVHDLEVSSTTQGCTLHIRIAASQFARLKDMRRNLTGRTGCGLCGTESLAQAVRIPRSQAQHVRFGASAVASAVQNLRARQMLLSVTGATHAAAWCDPSGNIVTLREDVGRHNALDKLIGALAHARADAASGFVAVTSRASYEMVQKTACAGIGTLAAVSGVTGLAVEVAQQAGLTLLGFARGDNLTVYTHPEQFEWKT
ncbi:formate dehydrogenase accessory sulfurtransferase FdhD [Rhodoferax sp. GW822-FHT02A01]|uniref:formate dehydrogenase accessory sulfurtransferase FdhD n=1 Tax=Rhodoferax sp. GW822-FHT02A01 TaxID=3141537 RepID=UPI00315DCAAE